MKKIFYLYIISLLLGIPAFAAQSYVFTAGNNTISIPTNNKTKYIPYSQYLKFYTLNADKIDAEYIYLSHSDENTFLKTLTKEEKEDYKYVKKVQKLIANNDWNNVFYQYPNFYPAYLQYYNFCMQNENYNEALNALNKIKNLDSKGQIFSSKLINLSFAKLYYKTRRYNQALNSFMMYENPNDDEILYEIANCHYNMGNYTKAIEYYNSLKNKTYDSQELIYDCYMRMKDFSNAYKIAKELLKQNYNYENLMRVQAGETNDSAKLSYCYHARELATMEKDIKAVNKVIADIEQKKLDMTVAKLNQFVKVPKWADIAKQIPQNVTISEIESKQDEFFKTANQYLSKYRGQDLNNAFLSLTQDYNNYLRKKQNEYYQEKQFELQQKMLDEQERQNALRQQLLYEQQVQNYIDSQYYYNYINRPQPYYIHHRHYLHPLMYMP